MSSLLERAVEDLRALGGEGISSRLDRVELAKDALVLAGTELDGRPVWFRWTPRDSLRLFPAEDSRVALARELGEREVDLLAWRPGRRIVVRERSPRGPGPVLKGYRRGRASEAARRHRIATEACRASGLASPPLLGCEPERDVLVLGLVPGSAPRLTERSSDIAFRVGARLVEFQRSEVSAPLDHHGVTEELGVLERWIELRTRIAGRPSPAEFALLARLCELAEGLPETEPVLAHRDLHDGQLLVSDDGIALLDFDLLCRADAVLDVANLLAHVSLRALQGVRGTTTAAARAWGDALLEGFDPSEEQWPTLRFYQAASLLRLAQVYAVRPRWQGVAPDLLELAQRCTSEIHVA